MSDVPFTALEPAFIRYLEQDGKVSFEASNIADAHGIMFLCPKCYLANGGPVGTHRVVCWSRRRGTPEHATPGPGRWYWSGADFARLTLNGDTGASSSVKLEGGCRWHGHIIRGLATV